MSSFSHEIKKYLHEHVPKKKCCEKALSYGLELFGSDNTIRETGFDKKIFKCPECKKYFIRSVFLICGTVTNPQYAYHLELIIKNEALVPPLIELLTECVTAPKTSRRKSRYILYYKESEAIEDFLSFIGAQNAAFDLMNTKILKDLRNTANRLANCDTANIGKSVTAAMEHIDAIHRLIKSGGFNKISDELQQTALLRLENDNATLEELAVMHDPPISKSGVNHRLKKLISMSLQIKN
jgi:DNA-binding protein WhiA